MARLTMSAAAVVTWLVASGCGPAGPGEAGEVAGDDAVASAWVPAPATATIQRVSDSGDCQGVVPAQLPNPVSTPPYDPQDPPPPAPGPAPAVCWGGITDGTGHVALAASNVAYFWRTVKPDGTPGGWFWGDEGTPLLPQARGWTGLSAVWTPSDGGATGTVYHRTYAPDGRIVTQREIRGDFRRIVEDPAGGSLVTYTLPLGDPRDPQHGLRVFGQRFDVAGAPRWAAGRTQIGTIPGPIGPDIFLTSGISTGGESVTIWGNRGVVTLVWRDRAGAQLFAASGREALGDLVGRDTAQPYYHAELQQLLEGSLAFRINGQWRRIFNRRAATSSPLPDWLSEHLDWDYRVTRGGRGYVILPNTSLGGTFPDCTQELVLASRNGRLCGRITLHTTPGTGVCNNGDVDQGWDGTIVRQLMSGHTGCGYAYWFRALAP